MSKVLKNICRTIIVILSAAFIEIFVINCSFWTINLNKNVRQNIHVYIDDLQALNWDMTAEMVSLIDPILIANDINTTVKTVSISVDTDGDIPYIDVFYINEEHPIPTEQNLVRIFEPFDKGTLKFEINEHVEQLRFDLGDSAGLVLNDITIIINQNLFVFSWARFFAIIIIYYVSIFLFGLQRSPDYDIIGDDVALSKPDKRSSLHLMCKIITIAIMSLLIIFAVCVIPNENAVYTSPHDDYYPIVSDSVAGYVDNYTVLKDGSVLFDGWAYDPENNNLTDKVYVVHNNTLLEYSQFEWYDRSGVGEALNNPILTTCGFRLTIVGIPPDTINQLKFLVKIGNNSYAEIQRNF